MTAGRRGGRLLVIGALTAPAAVGLAVTPAPAALAASSGITTPSVENQVFSSGNTLTVEATVPALTRPTTLTVTGPSGAKGGTSATQYPSTMTQKLSVVVMTDGGSAIGNGTWLVQLSGGITGSRHFITDFAPATPTGFSASGSGIRQVSFAWTLGKEPDLVGYALLDGTGAVLQDRIDPAKACAGSTCSAVVSYPSDSPGSHDYALVARRTGGTSAIHDSLRATASAILAGPAQRPVQGAAAGPSTSRPAAGSNGSPPRSNQPQRAVPTAAPGRSRPVLSSDFAAVAPSLGLPKLPAAPAPLIAGEAPLPQGTSAPHVPYQPGTQAEPSPAPGGVAIRTAAASVVDPHQLLPGLAAALVLLLGAAHLRRFLRTS